MNIIVRTYNGHYVTRPDTTWEKDNEDFFPPDYIDTLACTPVLFARICKPGRSVGLRFASRYYDSVNYGVLLYPADHIHDDAESYAEALTTDHTSFLPAPLFPVVELDGKPFILSKDGKAIFSGARSPAAIIEKSITEATSRLYIRTGDLIAIELAPMERTASREDGNFTLSGSLDGHEFLSFNVRFQ